MDATKKRAEKLQTKGKTVDFKELLRMEPDGGTTNIRNVKSKHWTRWLDAAKPAAGELAQGRGTPEVGIDSEFDPSVGDQRGPNSSISGSWRRASDLMYPGGQPLARRDASINESAEMLKTSNEFALRLRKEMPDDPEKAMARLLQENAQRSHWEA